MDAFNSTIFYILAAMTGISALAVVLTQNIVRAAAWLLFTLAGVSGLFFLLHADFVGATQLLVYVGGTLVLVVFGVMLTAQGPFIKMRIGVAEWAIALAVGLVLYSVLTVSLLASKSRTAPDSREASPAMADSTILGEALLGQKEASPFGRVTGMPPIRTAQGTLQTVHRNHLQMSYLLPFEIVSVHLLVVLIGAAYLARAKRRRQTIVAPGREQQLGASV